MSMTPEVAAARRHRKATAAAQNAAAVIVLVAMIVAVVATLGTTIIDGWKKHRADNEFRAALVEASKKSPAHHFLVTNWLQCSSFLQTPASCYASIRTTAASRGDAFVRQVDEAAKELDLL